MNSNQLSKKIHKELSDKGIVVSIQKSVTTTSVYLRVDHGVLRSIRIGDHPGKAQYKYGYEIGNHIKKRNEFFGEFNGTTFIRQRFPAEEVDDLIMEILLERSNKIAKYSKPMYEKYKQDGMHERSKTKNRRRG